MYLSEAEAEMYLSNPPKQKLVLPGKQKKSIDERSSTGFLESRKRLEFYLETQHLNSQLTAIVLSQTPHNYISVSIYWERYCQAHVFYNFDSRLPMDNAVSVMYAML